MHEGNDNGSGQYVNTDPNGNGVGQVPGQVQSPPLNNDGQNPSLSNTPAQNGQPGTTFAELAAKKGFKSPDDLAQSYDHLERKLGSQGSAPAPSPSPSGQQQPTTTSTPSGKSPIEQRLEALEQEREILRLERKYADLPQFADQVLAKVRQSPGLPLEDAYKAVKYDAAQEAARQEGYQQGVQQGSTVAEQKLRAATTMPGARNDMPAPSLEEKIKGAKTRKELEALEAMLPHS